MDGMTDLDWHPQHNAGYARPHPVKMPFSATYGTYCDGTQPILYPYPYKIGSGFYDYFRSALPQYISRVPASGRVHRAARPDIRSILIYIVAEYSRFYMANFADAEAEWDAAVALCETELDAMDTEYIHVHLTPVPNEYLGYTTEAMIPATREAPDWMDVDISTIKRDAGSNLNMTTSQIKEYLSDTWIQSVLSSITSGRPVDMVYFCGDASWMYTCSREGFFKSEKYMELAVSSIFNCVDPSEDAQYQYNYMLAVLHILRMFRYLHYNVEPPNPTW